MPLNILNKVKATGMSESVASSYEKDKKAIDSAIKKSDEPVKAKDAKPTVKENTTNLDEESFDKDQRPLHKVKLAGRESLLDCDFESVTGNESFVDMIRNGVRELIRIVKNFFTWLWELVYNRVTRISKRVRKLLDRLQGNGVKILTPVNYPSSIWRLAKTPNIPNNPEWIVNSVTEAHVFYKSLMKGQDALKKSAVELPNTVDRRQILNLVEHTTDQYAKAVLGKGITSGVTLLSDKLPGGRQHKVTFSTAEALGSYTSSMLITPMGSRKQPNGFIPDADVVRRILNQVLVAAKDIEGIHKSQSSLTREFEKVVNTLIRNGKYETKDGSKAAYQYYTWLIGFQQKSINSPLMYVFSVLNAAMDFCESSIK